MLSKDEILQTIHMIDQQHLDIRTITMGISLLSCANPDAKVCCQNIYDKICKKAEHLVSTGEAIEREFGIPIVNKRVSVTPISLVAAAFTVSPISLTASMLMPARVEPTLTEEHTSSVVASASGMERMSLTSDSVMPFCTRAE